MYNNVQAKPRLPGRQIMRTLFCQLVSTIVFLTLTFAAPQLTLAETSPAGLFGLENFASSVVDGSTAARGIYVKNVLALKIAPQPANNAGYVTTLPNTVTQFSLASSYGTLGLLAHNYLAGATFFDLRPGQEVQVVYGNGTIRTYRITHLYSYLALEPQSVQSDFINMATSERVSAQELFKQLYMGENKLTLQTCLTINGNPLGGRYFVTATRSD